MGGLLGSGALLLARLPAASAAMKLRRLYVVLGDQLDAACVVDADFDPRQDALWMCERGSEARRAWSHQMRLVYFLSAMRHFRERIEQRGWRLIYREVDDHGADTLAQRLLRDLRELQPGVVLITRPGDLQLWAELRDTLQPAGQPWRLREDPHFYTTPADFSQWARGRSQLRMEYFYREQRQRFKILVEADGAPRGGRWNFDADNRQSFDAQGPQRLDAPRRFAPDRITAQVIAEVQQRYGDHPGRCDGFDWPVTPEQAREALADFIAQRLPAFGRYQDAMWLGEPYLFHSRLSAAMNLHLIEPRTVVDAAIAALENGDAPLPAVEGFVRQILGWREYVRGIYWHRAERWATDNALDAMQALPAFYWSGATPMRCLADTLQQTLEHGYAHHIQRLMVSGLYALLLGVQPAQIEAWFHAIYVDAVAWVEVPNTLAMSQFADGGVLASKPYIASGSYIRRMSNACDRCRFKPQLRTGPQACPFTTLYWDFLLRHEQRFRDHPRLGLQLRNLARLDAEARAAIRQQASRLRERGGP